MREAVQILQDNSVGANTPGQSKILTNLKQIKYLPFNSTITDIHKGLLSSLEGDQQSGLRQLQTAGFKAQREGENQLNDIIRAMILKLSRR